MKNKKLTRWVRFVVIICGLVLFAVLILPIWRIELSAPQYPEGLVLLIYANKLAGNVDIINGLNHYIGMKTLHAEDFIEFAILPYILGGLAMLTLLAGLINRRKIFIGLTIFFIAISIISMIDFWRWMYNYGHDLDPHAAIIVPGMAYQPPLLGYKQLLNFGAYSIPDAGGWIFIAVAVLLTGSCIYEIWQNKKLKQIKEPIAADKIVKAAIPLITMLLLVTSCNTDPEPIKPGADNCYFCKMGVSDIRFATEVLTKKGKVYKFDDGACLLSFLNSNAIPDDAIKEIYFVDFSGDHSLIKVNEAILIKSPSLKSPMGGNIAAFAKQDSAKAVIEKLKAVEVNWNSLNEK